MCTVRNETLIPKNLKMDLLNKIAGDDKSLDGEKARIYCKYAMPEEEVKKEAWQLIMNPRSDMSRKMREEIINAFQHPNQ